MDFVLDRADKTVNLCEMNYSAESYEIDKDEQIRNRRALFSKETGAKET